jgi:protein ImuB
VLDITGCAGLFGGEASMLSELLTRLFHQGFAATAAIAPTPGAAHALARYRPMAIRNADDPDAGTTVDAPVAMPVVAQGRTPAAIAPLPLAGLRLDGGTLATLARLGLRTLGQVMERPRAPLTRRFGRELLFRLDQALGTVEEAISPRLPIPARIAERSLAEPVSRMEDVELLVRHLAGSLEMAMERHGEGARSLELALFRIDGFVSRLRVSTSRPLRDADSIARLFRERLAAVHDSLDAGCGYDLIRLAALSCEDFDPAEQAFFDRAGGLDAAAGLVDRLSARLGPAAVLLAAARDTHVPEEAEILHPAMGKDVQASLVRAEDTTGLPPIRPARLLARPEAVDALAEVPDGPPLRFRWRRILHEVRRAEGPERIAGEWWRGETQPRDYFRVEDAEGRRFWLFRQGLYDGTTEPHWFLHGLFA